MSSVAAYRLLKYLSNLTSAYCTATFTDSELKAFFHGYRSDQLYGRVNVTSISTASIIVHKHALKSGKFYLHKIVNHLMTASPIVKAIIKSIIFFSLMFIVSTKLNCLKY